VIEFNYFSGVISSVKLFFFLKKEASNALYSSFFVKNNIACEKLC